MQRYLGRGISIAVAAILAGSASPHAHASSTLVTAKFSGVVTTNGGGFYGQPFSIVVSYNPATFTGDVVNYYSIQPNAIWEGCSGGTLTIEVNGTVLLKRTAVTAGVCSVTYLSALASSKTATDAFAVGASATEIYPKIKLAGTVVIPTRTAQITIGVASSRKNFLPDDLDPTPPAFALAGVNVLPCYSADLSSNSCGPLGSSGNVSFSDYDVDRLAGGGFANGYWGFSFKVNAASVSVTTAD